MCGGRESNPAFNLNVLWPYPCWPGRRSSLARFSANEGAFSQFVVNMQ